MSPIDYPHCAKVVDTRQDISVQLLPAVVGYGAGNWFLASFNDGVLSIKRQKTFLGRRHHLIEKKEEKKT